MSWHDELRGCRGFEWDAGNATKNRERHRVSRRETEQVFFNQPLVIACDDEHSDWEARHYALGQTTARRLLFVVFVRRGDLVRVISARDMTKREREVYRTHGQEVRHRRGGARVLGHPRRGR